jgi:hypothetical protein
MSSGEVGQFEYGSAKIALATSPPLWHNASMVEAHPLSIKIEPGRVDGRRFWWSVCDGDRVIERSSYSLPTRREAEKEATEARSRAETRRRIK